MPPPVHFYMDDSGTRDPDRKQTPFDPKHPDHFSLGGVLILEEDEGTVRASHAQFFDGWGLTIRPKCTISTRNSACSNSEVGRRNRGSDVPIRLLSVCGSCVAELPVTFRGSAMIVTLCGVRNSMRSLVPLRSCASAS